MPDKKGNAAAAASAKAGVDKVLLVVAALIVVVSVVITTGGLVFLVSQRNGINGSDEVAVGAKPVADPTKIGSGGGGVKKAGQTSKSPDNPEAFIKYRREAQEQCFCQLKGHVDDCACSVDTVDHFNNDKIFPRMQSLLVKDFFRYFAYNPNKACTIWDASLVSAEKCTSERCQVTRCSEKDLPPGLIRDEEEAAEECQQEPDAAKGGSSSKSNDDRVDATISEAAKKDIKAWKSHDASQAEGFCELEVGPSCKDCVHVDLTINPERFTGYSGDASGRIWKAVYLENCFRPPSEVEDVAAEDLRGQARDPLRLFVRQDKLSEMCLEKRSFYRAVSGLHSSITIHLSARYPVELMSKKRGNRVSGSAGGGGPFLPSLVAHGDDAKFKPNLDLFLSRFNPEATEGQGPFWLKNLYFVYLLELRAILKAAPYLERQAFYTGNDEEDRDTRKAVRELLAVIRTFPDHYDESRLFASGDTSADLKEDFRQHFRNISKVMDCVTCDKCKLWGKLQTTGLGTALKILFTPAATSSSGDPQAAVDVGPDSGALRLSRNEVVALFNAFGRISTSIRQLEVFRQMIREEGDSSSKPSPSASIFK